MLSIFPALLLLVSALGLIGQSATKPLLDNVDALAPGAVRDLVTQAIENLQRSQGAAGILFIVGLLLHWRPRSFVNAILGAVTPVGGVLTQW